MDPKSWIVPMVEAWAEQKRRIHFPRSDGHIEGWSTRTIIGKILDEGAGASHSSGRAYQRHPEVYQGDALLVQRAIVKMPERPRAVLIAHHVIKNLRAHEKAAAIGISRIIYYHNLDLAYAYLAGRIDEFHERKVA